MFTQINETMFRDAFKKAKRDSFSYNGYSVLFNYLESFEEETDRKIELDVIAIDSNFTESSINEVLSDYNLESLEDLEDNTTVLRVDNDTVIYQNY